MTSYNDVKKIEIKVVERALKKCYDHYSVIIKVNNYLNYNIRTGQTLQRSSQPDVLR